MDFDDLFEGFGSLDSEEDNTEEDRQRREQAKKERQEQERQRKLEREKQFYQEDSKEAEIFYKMNKQEQYNYIYEYITEKQKQGKKDIWLKYSSMPILFIKFVEINHVDIDDPIKLEIQAMTKGNIDSDRFNKIREQWYVGKYQIFQVQSIEIQKKWQKKIEIEKLQEFYQEYQNLQFIRIGTDESLYYGDGGDITIRKPLYYTEKLNFEKEKQNRLVQLLNKLGNERQDWHETCPVQDIIDPELNPYYNPEYQIGLQSIHEDQDDYYKYYEEQQWVKDIRKNMIEEKKLYQENEYVSLRAQYQWIPTNFLVRKDLKAKIQGQIHNLPKEGNQELYNLFENLFEKMLLGFQQIQNFIEFKDKNTVQIQVVIKAQKYVLKPGMSYEGKWHVEGKTENIKGVGVYYCSIDDGFKSDSLQFRPLQYPQETYVSNQNTVGPWQINIQEGTALTFENVMPHKFNKLENNTEKDLERLFVNFFIVDPNKDKLFSTQDFQFIQKILRYTKLSENIKSIITQFLGFNSNIEIAKQKRKVVRENSGKEVSGWGFISYGNSGDVQFCDSFNQAKYTSEYDKFENQQNVKEEEKEN